MAASENTFCDKITHSKQKVVHLNFVEQNYGSHIFYEVQNCTNLFEIDTFYFNSYTYKRGSVISFEKSLFEIEMILVIDTQFSFIVKKLEFLGVHNFFRSLKVKNSLPIQYSLIEYDDILYRKPYCCKFISESKFVIIDSRDILKTL